jgi:phosphotransferase system enzyme I (PtsP)
MAGSPIDAMALVAIGFRSLSMAPQAVGPVRQMIRSIDVSRLTTYVNDLLARRASSLRAELRAFARDHGAIVG